MKSDTISYSEYLRLHGPPTVTIQQTTWERALKIERLAREAIESYGNPMGTNEAEHAAIEALRKALL